MTFHGQNGAILKMPLSRNEQELVERGWVQQDEETCQPTAEGKRLRDEAEALTDTYFFAAWSCLSESELEELASLASQLRDELKKSKSK